MAPQTDLDELEPTPWWKQFADRTLALLFAFPTLLLCEIIQRSEFSSTVEWSLTAIAGLGAVTSLYFMKKYVSRSGLIQ